MQNPLMGTQSYSDHSFENEFIHQDFIMNLIHDLLKSTELPKACLFIQQIFITTQQSSQQGVLHISSSGGTLGCRVWNPKAQRVSWDHDQKIPQLFGNLCQKHFLLPCMVNSYFSFKNAAVTSLNPSPVPSFTPSPPPHAPDRGSCSFI